MLVSEILVQFHFSSNLKQHDNIYDDNCQFISLTPANEVWDKVMVLLASVILSGGGVCLGVLPDRDPPLLFTVKSARYASYWNAFLFILNRLCLNGRPF